MCLSDTGTALLNASVRHHATVSDAHDADPEQDAGQDAEQDDGGARGPLPEGCRHTQRC